MNGFAAVLALVASLRVMVEPPGFGIAVWFLALVFTWSGLAKLRRPVLAAMAMVDFGVVNQVRTWQGKTLGIFELLLAATLALGLLSQLFLPLAAVLLWIFALLIARSLWAGEHFACFCFGDTEGHLSGWILARTIALALLSSALAFTSPPPTYSRPGPTEALQAIAALAFLSIVVLVGTIPRLLRG